MHTIITNEIDGYKVIAGFGTQTIDPEATKNIVAELLAGSPEASAVKSKNDEINRVARAYSDAAKASKQAYKNGNVSLCAKHQFEMGQREEQLKSLQAEAVELYKSQEAKRLELWNANLVYFEPKSGELVVDDAAAAELQQKLTALTGKNAVLLADGTQLCDYRGVKYVYGGEIKTVDALGVEPGGPLVADVTPEQFEQMRLDAMSAEDKQAELDAVIDGLAGQAASMRAKLEIKNDKDALKKAQSWYNEQLEKALFKYGSKDA